LKNWLISQQFWRKKLIGEISGAQLQFHQESIHPVVAWLTAQHMHLLLHLLQVLHLVTLPSHHHLLLEQCSSTSFLTTALAALLASSSGRLEPTGGLLYWFCTAATINKLVPLTLVPLLQATVARNSSLENPFKPV
jgi:hypothetical protein